MAKEEFSSILKAAFDQGTPFINSMEFYSYALIPQGDGKWLEVSYDFEEKEIMDKNTIDDTQAWMRFCEEIEKAMSEEIEDFMLIKWREFKKGLGGSDGDKLKAGIQELLTNPTTYSKNLPIVFNKDDLDKVFSRL